jgi:hypothetical protein
MEASGERATPISRFSETPVDLYQKYSALKPPHPPEDGIVQTQLWEPEIK